MPNKVQLLAICAFICTVRIQGKSSIYKWQGKILINFITGGPIIIEMVDEKTYDDWNYKLEPDRNPVLNVSHNHTLPPLANGTVSRYLINTFLFQLQRNCFLI